ncbi:hypothetical protein FAES_0676 [Fibrella aestuarina BUZ 2]|uniref:6-phosphogluconate dehydrogenase n=1 Tax=Fibrella aestuarina BUZ 2 TaxID=1166018 RepID=I0K3I4_9BACT|nr:hypothetical protein [Fibrella aestuarina]CCG98687.1 hypothetical protein FAES_0676 [Fibrella aestuarina BUZ 2]
MRFFTYLLVFVLLVLGVLFLLTGWSYSDGERAGTVSKFSRRGYLFKTYEGVLNVGGFSGETGSLTPQFFDFSVKDDAVAQKITEAVKTGQRVTLHYEEKILRLPWNGETKYYITDVEFVGQTPYGQQPFGGQQQVHPQPGTQQPAQPTPAPESQSVTADSVL